jgi:hypothetical protein
MMTLLEPSVAREVEKQEQTGPAKGLATRRDYALFVRNEFDRAVSSSIKQ